MFYFSSVFLKLERLILKDHRRTLWPHNLISCSLCTTELKLWLSLTHLSFPASALWLLPNRVVSGYEVCMGSHGRTDPLRPQPATHTLTATTCRNNPGCWSQKYFSVDCAACTSVMPTSHTIMWTIRCWISLLGCQTWSVWKTLGYHKFCRENILTLISVGRVTLAHTRIYLSFRNYIKQSVSIQS